jgi:phage regulator Rha-like protein
MAKLEKDLQEAILAMPQKEKDKILLKLIAKDEVLTQQLQFQLVEVGDTMESRRDDIRKTIDKLYNIDHYSSGYLMMDMRYISGDITRHVKVTKDKYGDVELTLKLLKDCFEKQLKWIQKYSSKSDTLANYVAKRADITLKKLIKLHPDIQFDFHGDMNYVLECCHRYAPAIYAISLALPKSFEIQD